MNVLFKFMSVGLCLVAFSCSSMAETARADIVQVRLLERKELSRDFGVKTSENPFISPMNLLFKPLFDFAVVSIDVTATSPMTLQILSASMFDAAGDKVADLDSIEQFLDMWHFYGKADLVHTLDDKIERSYVPNLRYTAKTGKTRRILVIRGKYPVTKPYTVTIKLLANNEEQSFSWTVE